MTTCTRCGEPKDVHDAGENYACQAQPTVTFQEEGEAERSLRIAVWNTLRERGVKQEACYPIIEGAVSEFRAAIAKAMTNARDGTE